MVHGEVVHGEVVHGAVDRGAVDGGPGSGGRWTGGAVKWFTEPPPGVEETRRHRGARSPEPGAGRAAVLMLVFTHEYLPENSTGEYGLVWLYLRNTAAVSFYFGVLLLLLLR